MQTSEIQIPQYDADTLRRVFRRRMIIIVVAVLVLAVGIVGFNLVKAHFIAKALAQNASPKQTVATATVKFDGLAAADRRRGHAARGARCGCHD